MSASELAARLTLGATSAANNRVDGSTMRDLIKRRTKNRVKTERNHHFVSKPKQAEMTQGLPHRHRHRATCGYMLN
jgi:hypothetical protein